MRVIAGKMRGRRLRGPVGHELRPTSDRLKESLFNILGAGVADSDFLDAFAGTGSIGIEALSRGARDVVFVEGDARACRLIRANLELCGLASGHRLLHSDIYRALRQLAREGKKFDLVYLDPPYAWEKYEELLGLIHRGLLVRPEGRIVVEHHRKAPLPEACEEYRLIRRVRQGDGCLSFYADLATVHRKVAERAEPAQ
jgi:16S rRNA (guanine966-N2)-methyltransferase